MMDMPEDQAASVSLKHIIGSDMIAEVLAEPRKIPADVRRNVAIRLASSLFGNDAPAELPDDIPDAVNTVIRSKEWEQMKDAAGKNDLIPKLILGTVLRALLDSQDNGGNISDEMRRAWEIISSFIRTMDILSSLSPVSGFNYSIRNAHSELIDHTEAYENLVERNDDLEWMAEVMRFMESELFGRDNSDKRSNDRNVLMIIDTSKSMYGEPEMIAKSLSLAVTKQMMRIGKRTEVLFFPSDLPLLSPSDGRGMMDLLSHRSVSESSFTDALNMLMNRMKQGSFKNTDVILASKGTGVLNDPGFTHDWETFRTGNGIRVFTAVTGGGDACALTELSDHVMIFSDSSIHNKSMEFAKLIDVLRI
jgi:hypothetical protein